MWEWAGRHLTYRPEQRRVLTILLSLLLAFAFVLLIVHRTFIDNPPAPQGDRAAELADRLDPNTADWSELAALPLIGEKRARAVVARRELVKARNPKAVAFQKPQDLFYVDGFGPAVVEQLKPYLIFPTTSPTASPTTNTSE